MKIGVIMGGISSEEIFLNTGKEIMANLDEEMYENSPYCNR